MDIDTFYKTLEKIQKDLQPLKDDDGNLIDGVDIDKNDKNTVMTTKMLHAKKILFHLNEIKKLLDWENKPIIAEGVLKKDDKAGFYFIEGTNKILYTGDEVEVFIEHEDGEEENCYLKTFIEYADDDYYFAHFGKSYPLIGKKVRVR